VIACCSIPLYPLVWAWALLLLVAIPVAVIASCAAGSRCHATFLGFVLLAGVLSLFASPRAVPILLVSAIGLEATRARAIAAKQAHQIRLLRARIRGACRLEASYREPAPPPPLGSLDDLDLVRAVARAGRSRTWWLAACPLVGLAVALACTAWPVICLCVIGRDVVEVKLGGRALARAA